MPGRMSQITSLLLQRPALRERCASRSRSLAATQTARGASPTDIRKLLQTLCGPNRPNACVYAVQRALLAYTSKYSANSCGCGRMLTGWISFSRL
jgi:hypothetical protein